MIVTSRCAKWLQALPDDEATRIIDMVTTVAANPDAPSRHCKKLGANLWEARLTLHHRRRMRVMFGYRDGTPVLLTALEKRDAKRHRLEIDHARAALTSDMPQGVPLVADAPALSVHGSLYTADGRSCPITHHTRRKIVVATEHGPVTLDRCALEQDGYASAGEITYYVVRAMKAAQSDDHSRRCHVPPHHGR